MATQKVTITYTASPTFLATEHWKQFHAALLSQLPLRNLHWKSAIRPNIRTIQELNITFVSADTKQAEHTSQIPQTVLEKPLLSTYIVVCDDYETYKNTTKRQIKEWHSSVVQRKNLEWLIIYIVRPDAKTTANRMFQMKSSVLDKIKADFNTDRRDRCVELVWSYDSEFEDPTAWAELIGKVKEGILSAFDAALTQREEEVKRSEGQRQMPGWNFCTFFILKESLANSFEGMGLYEDALETYDELEALFYQVLREKNLSWFGTLITPAPNDDSLPLLSPNRKPYRDMILANTISVFDFRTYLFARQCILLGYLGRVVEIARKAIAFLNSFGRRLREVENTLPQYFIESWTYSSALSVVEQCDAWATGWEMDKTTAISFAAVKGELVELARHQLDIIGVSTGHLPAKPPFSVYIPKRLRMDHVQTDNTRRSRQISKTELLTALGDREAFYEIYKNTTSKALDLYASADRRKFALRMYADLAALDILRGKLNEALQTYTSLPAHYARHGWTSMESHMLSTALGIHQKAEKPRDREWIYIVLNFLKAYVQDFGKEIVMCEEDREAYVAKLVESLHDAVQNIDSDVMHPDHPAFSIYVADHHARTADDRDGALLNVIVFNGLPCSVPTDDITVHLSGRDNTQLAFSEKVTSLSPGKNVISLFSHSATPGMYAFHSSQITVAHLRLQWSHASKKSDDTWKGRRQPRLITIPRDLRALDIKLRPPKRIELGKTPCIIVAFSSGRNNVVEATIKLTGPSGIEFKHSDATLADEETVDLKTTKDAIILSDVKADKTVRITVPHTDASADIAVVFAVDYTTAVEANLARSLRLSRIVVTSPAVATNVEDFFRGTRLFTRFTLNARTHQHVRIKSTELRALAADDKLKITKSIPLSTTVTTVTPTQPARFVFQLDSIRGTELDQLQLHITYRVLREEVHSLIAAALDSVLSESPSLQSQRAAIFDALVSALEKNSSWVALYEATGEIIPPPGSLAGDGTIGEGLSRAVEVLSKGPTTPFFGEWNELITPVDVPQVHITAAARLRVLSKSSSHDIPERLSPLFAGQPISATLTVTTSFHWAPKEDADRRSYLMRYDIEEITHDWLVSGQKRGDFTATDGDTFSVPVTLIALHHGVLNLPKVAIRALPVAGSGESKMNSSMIPSCEVYQVHGAETVLVLPRGGRSTFVVRMGNDS
ncbi:hypothetical protein K474DRAFT_1681152 [Panus rudis PR-1116 ss-1]|nr:hypothetical protein K474DRAFT_1681152 [Panus rudis PR-1116 ss-1]